MNKKLCAMLLALVFAAVCLVACKEEQQQPTETLMDGQFFWDELPSTDPQPESQPEDQVPATEPTQGETEGATEAPTVSGETTAPTQGESSTQPTQGPEELTFEEYLKMSADEQRAFSKTFPSREAFDLWYDQALAESDRNNVIEVTGPIDLGQLGGN